MKNTCNDFNELGYDGIADYYEKWCEGDPAYFPSLRFYRELLQGFSGPFLEIGVGTGRIALEVLKRQSVLVTGIDLSERMLNICRFKYNKLQNSGSLVGKLELFKGSMDTVNLCLPYQVVYIPFRTIGHILDDEQLKRLFIKVRSVLVPGGYFIFDHYVFDIQWAREHNNKPIPMYSDKDLMLTDRYRYDFDQGLMDCSICNGDKELQRFLFRWIEPETFRTISARTGFTVDKVYGGFDFSPWNGDSKNQIWVLKKSYQKNEQLY